ncbi:sialate O-acetylesterase-like [Trematomus bernacchii]|uniref:sialate O-acetylesterase-like n=1 Tax=Trematomus bernacchii TaxID=40690 RepID=UPI00146ED423|nr:sialate O-acetylesterase-like [Trematomus bernacchii]
MDRKPVEGSQNWVHPRDKQDVAFRLSLGARAVAYGEQDVAFRGPFPSQILSTPKYLEITYDQKVSVTPSENIFELYWIVEIYWNLTPEREREEMICSKRPSRMVAAPCGTCSIRCNIYQWLYMTETFSTSSLSY